MTREISEARLREVVGKWAAAHDAVRAASDALTKVEMAMLRKEAPPAEAFKTARLAHAKAKRTLLSATRALDPAHRFAGCSVLRTLVALYLGARHCSHAAEVHCSEAIGTHTPDEERLLRHDEWVRAMGEEETARVALLAAAKG